MRARKPIDYDAYADDANAQWNYERGRQWAAIAPRSLPLRIDGRLNPVAIRLYDMAVEKGYITREYHDDDQKDDDEKDDA